MSPLPSSKLQQPLLSRKAREFARREEEILSAALECFSGEDWESVTVAQIADIVGIAKGTMYSHFASKHDIYARLTLDFYSALLEHLQSACRGTGVDRMVSLIEQAFRFYLQQPKYRCVTQYCEREDFRCKLDPALAAQFDAIDMDFYQLLHRELALGIDAGVFKPLAIDQQILGLKCTFHGALTVLWCNRSGEQQHPESFIRNVTQYMLSPIVVNSSSLHRHSSSQQPKNPNHMLKQEQTLEIASNE